MPDLTTRIRDWIAARLAAATVKQVIAGVVAAIGVAGGLAWSWVWHHVNPQFAYEARPSSVASHFVGMGQVLNQIDKDTQLYCTGGWDQRLAEFALRRCYRFQFEPSAAYRMMVCTHDEKTLAVSTSDQLVALQYFEQAFRPRECFHVLPQAGKNDYVVRMGKDGKLAELQFTSGAPQTTAFCGCSDSEVSEVALALGAKVN